MAVAALEIKTRQPLGGGRDFGSVGRRYTQLDATTHFAVDPLHLLNRRISDMLSADAHRPGGPVGIPIAGDDPNAIAIASNLIRQIGYEPVLIGGLAKGKSLVPGTPLGGEHTPAEIRQIAAGLG